MTRRRVGVIMVALALAITLIALLVPVIYDYPSHGLGCVPTGPSNGTCQEMFQSLTLEYFQYGGARFSTGQYCIFQVIHTSSEWQTGCVLG
jgi:hypothetical protein